MTDVAERVTVTHCDVDVTELFSTAFISHCALRKSYAQYYRSDYYLRWTSMFRSGGTATTATIGTVGGGTTPTPQFASAQVASLSAHDSAAAWRLPRLNGTTAAGSRAGSAAATKRQQQRNNCR